MNSTGLNREITQLEVLAALQALPQDGRNYTVEFEAYTIDDTVESNCNEILIWNRGEKLATINGMLLSAGDVVGTISSPLIDTINWNTGTRPAPFGVFS